MSEELKTNFDEYISLIRNIGYDRIQQSRGDCSPQHILKISLQIFSTMVRLERMGAIPKNILATKKKKGK